MSNQNGVEQLVKRLLALEQEVKDLRAQTSQELSPDQKMERLAARLASKYFATEKGDPGESGEQGPQGEQGAQGETGPAGADGKDGKDGKNGRDGLNGKDGAQGPKGNKGDPGDIKDVSPQEIRNELELLQGDERLDKSAVKGIEELEIQLKDVAARPNTRTMTPSGPMLYTNGTKRGRAQTINIVGGSGVSVSYAQAGGRNDITISATGTVALNPIAMTGTIDDSNKSFIAASTPTLVIVNGTPYRHGKGVTISGTSVTLDNPVGSNPGNDIYGL